MTSVTESIWRFAAGLEFAQLPSEVQDSARDRLLDALSTAIAARDVPTTRAVLAASAGLDPSGPCTVLPTAASASVSDAVLVNGTAIHAILYEDINLVSSDHPGPVIVAAALGAAEACAALTGRDGDIESLLTGIVAGYEVHLALGRVAASGVKARGLRTTAIFGTVSAAVASARILGLAESQFRSAIALGANMSFGFLEGFAHGTMEPYVQAGLAARAGILATLLGRSGVATADVAFEGAHGYLRGLADVVEPVALDLGTDWHMRGVTAKPYPISGAKIGPVDSARAAHEIGYDPADIDRVVVRLKPGIKEFPGADVPGPFTSMNQAQDSTQFCVAAALLGRDMASLQTVMRKFADHEIEALAPRIELVSEPGRTLTRVDVHLHGGAVVTGEVDWTDRQVPTIASMSTKLRTLSEGFWRTGVVDAVIEVICGPTAAPMHSLTRLLRAT